ncbi:MAG TPA: acyltransferase [Bacteroidia bacterium]|jgi:peptidoglycan/LPS O-acetylase OafA/YrhL|nr:acyltransferase [Bacteroidia bacterium]
MEIKTNRLPIIDTLRGIAALSVCFFHLITNPSGFIYNQSIISISRFGHYGVHIFFIISGIVIPLSMIHMDYTYSKLGRFLLKRVVRIEPPYIAAVILGILYFNLRNHIGATIQVDLSPTLRDILLHLGYLIPFVHGARWINTVFWSLSVEFQYYLFLALLFPLVLRYNNWRYLFYSIIFLLPFSHSTSNFFPYWSTYFLIGISYALFISAKISKAELWCLLFISFVIIYITQGIGDLVVGAITLGIIHLFSNFKSVTGAFFGQISYSLYLIHSLIGIPVINILAHKVSTPIGKFMVLVFGVSVSIMFAFFFFKLIENPSQRFSKKIKA